jgi:hypothetical protein
MEEPVVPIAAHVAPSIEPLSDPQSRLPDVNDAPRVLTPPASEEEMDKGHQSSSELSDINLDEEDDDIGEIEPDHYFDGGKIPVFKPVSPLAQRLAALPAVHGARAHGPHQCLCEDIC